MLYNYLSKDNRMMIVTKNKELAWEECVACGGVVTDRRGRTILKVPEDDIRNSIDARKIEENTRTLRRFLTSRLMPKRR